MPRDTPSSRDSSREDGSRSPPRSRPPLIASRRLASSWARSGWLAERSSRTNSSGPKPDHSIAMKLDLITVPAAPYCPGMSTLTQAQPATSGGAPTRLISPPLALTFLAEFTSLTSFFLLLSVMPMLAAAAGAGSSGAGLITRSLLLGTVAAEAAAAAGIRRFGYRAMLAAGAALLGAPALALLGREPQAVMMAVSFVRGLGFGLCGVVTATLLPPGRRGEGLGLLGVVSGVPAVVALPAGVWLAGHHQATAVAAMAAAAGLLPLATIRWLPRRGEARTSPPDARARRAP